ncbi:hypothetical protein TRAPUB_11014 [Trametes pubescens]|uniref:Uncharacterized protein n=1 Tax=Trametes pubescens TaxID=154538 RepID=A0A1M2VXV3_TRAPU|nr:hypothetical protein TRAPUB_11014 [Trametes pubescens]
MIPPPIPRVSPVPLPACSCCDGVEEIRPRSSTEELIHKIDHAIEFNVTPECVDSPELREWMSPPADSLSRFQSSFSPSGSPILLSEASSSFGLSDTDAANSVVYTGSFNSRDSPPLFKHGSHYTLGHSPLSQHHYSDHVPRSWQSHPSFISPDMPTPRMENALGLFDAQIPYSITAGNASPHVPARFDVVPVRSRYVHDGTVGDVAEARSSGPVRHTSSSAARMSREPYPNPRTFQTLSSESPRLSDLGEGFVQLRLLPFDTPVGQPTALPSSPKLNMADSRRPISFHRDIDIPASSHTTKGCATQSPLLSGLSMLSLSEGSRRLIMEDGRVHIDGV